MAEASALPDDRQFAELRELVWQVHAGIIDAAGIGQLDKLVCARLDLRREYIQFTQALALTRTSVSGQPLTVPGAAEAKKRFSIFAYRSIVSPRLIGIAASLLLVGYFMTVGGLLMWDRIRRTDDHARLAAVPAADSPALLTRADDADWQQETSTPAKAESNQRKLHVRSGLAELKFARGASVIVEGPADFEVRSNNSGFLHRGRLSANVPAAAVGFTIETPTAQIIDLGTEFDVEVKEGGVTDVRVERGVVQVAESKSPRVGSASQPLRLSAGQAIQVNSDGLGAVAVAQSARRVIAKSKEGVEFLDLVDMVAGGDGRRRQRNRGIDAATGRVVYRPDDDFSPFSYRQSNGYCRPDDRPFIDGVGIPDSAKGPVQLDSAGHVFANFPKTDGTAYGPVWAGGSVPERTPIKLRTTFDGKLDYAVAPHGLIALYPNKLITFDLDALRREDRGRRLLSFRATVGVTTPDPVAYPGLADTWIFIDGELRHSRPAIDASHGPQDVEIVLPKTARFLTLAATDGGNTPTFDWVLFGDPRIELESNDE